MEKPGHGAADRDSVPARRRVDTTLFKDALRTVAGPATIVTALDGAQARATTVSAFCSVSADPPLVVVCLDRQSNLLETLTATKQCRFSVHVLKPGQQDLAMDCATKNPDKLAGTVWREVDGVPYIESSGTWLSCEVEALHQAGDHVLVVGMVTDCVVNDGSCLVYRNRSFHEIA